MKLQHKHQTIILVVSQKMYLDIVTNLIIFSIKINIKIDTYI